MILRRMFVMLAALALLLTGAACAEEAGGPEVADDGLLEDQGLAEDEGLDEDDVLDDEAFVEDDTELGALAADPASFVDQTVTVSGTVSEIVNTTAFRIGGDDIVGDALLVIGADAAEVSPDELVQVTGVVRDYDEGQLEEELGDEFDAEAFEGIEDEFTLVAQNVRSFDEAAQ